MALDIARGQSTEIDELTGRLVKGLKLAGQRRGRKQPMIQ
jgi:ketopantoate reductase